MTQRSLKAAFLNITCHERAGMREYWVANPKLRSIEVYSLTGGEYTLHGEYGPGERLTSPLLPGLDLLTDTVFTA